MDPRSTAARKAGWLYLLCAMPAPFSLLYVPSKLIVRNDPAETATRILSHQMMFRTAMVLEIAVAIAFLFAVLAVARLFEDFDRRLARLMVLLYALSIPISLLNSLNQVAPLTLLRGTDFLARFDAAQRDAFAMVFLRLYSHGVNLAAIFWGLWLLPLALLIVRSRFLPRAIGAFLFLNGLAYPVITLAQFLVPSYQPAIARYATIFELGELVLIAYLIIFGIRQPQPTAAAATA
ncbi:MAG: hypothetical protein NVS9B15_03220 [Acidobacteriaceae bacterium]